MISDVHFNPEAPKNRPMRFAHDCSKKPDQVLTVTRVHDGWVYHCYRCGDRGKRYLEGLTPTVMAKLLKEKGKMGGRVKEVYLPEDYQVELPPKPMAHMLRYELDPLQTKPFCGWSPSWNRIIFPAYAKHTGRLDFWTGRTMGEVVKGKNAKWYHSVRSDIGRPVLWIPQQDKDVDIVVVEDPISAVKVWMAGFTAVAVLGSYIPDDIFIHPGTKYLWLDDDMKRKVLGKVRRMRSLGYAAQGIYTKGDPKTYTVNQIKELIT